MQKLFFIITLLCFFSFSVQAAEKEAWNADGQFRRAFVIDDGLSALRKSPKVTSTCLRRLRVGRKIFIISSIKNQDGIKYYYIAITRRTRGFIDAASVVSPSQAGDDARLMRLIEASKGVEKIILAQILVSNFPKSRFCPDALLAEGEAAEKIALELSKKISRRLPEQLDKELELERYLLNNPILDKYSRLGINFYIDTEEKFYRYDGAVYKQILSRYPRSLAASHAKEKLQILIKPTKE
ncbi:MAG: hypothetical protein IPK14_25025 [Blastocatellia bacterium]|nr:hypothetical protein [Blastocatellia bacterium]